MSIEESRAEERHEKEKKIPYSRYREPRFREALAVAVEAFRRCRMEYNDQSQGCSETLGKMDEHITDAVARIEVIFEGAK